MTKKFKMNGEIKKTLIIKKFLAVLLGLFVLLLLSFAVKPALINAQSATAAEAPETDEISPQTPAAPTETEEAETPTAPAPSGSENTEAPTGEPVTETPATEAPPTESPTVPAESPTAAATEPPASPTPTAAPTASPTPEQTPTAMPTETPTLEFLQDFTVPPYYLDTDNDVTVPPDSSASPTPGRASIGIVQIDDIDNPPREFRWYDIILYAVDVMYVLAVFSLVYGAVGLIGLIIFKKDISFSAIRKRRKNKRGEAEK